MTIGIAMTEEVNLQNRTGELSSEVVLLERDGRFFFYQPTYGLIVSGDNIVSAYEKFEETQRTFLEDVRRSGLAISNVGPAPTATGVAVHRGVIAEIGLFAAKFGVVLLVLGAALVFAVQALQGSLAGASQAMAGVTQAVSRVAASFGAITLQDVVNKSDDVVRDFNSLPKERKEELRRNVGEVSRQLTPIIDAWRNPSDSQEAK